MGLIYVIGGVASFVLVGGLVGFTWAQINRLRYALSPERRLARLVAGVPATAIADVRDGQLVKICGTVRLPQSPLVAPFSGRPCVYYRATATRAMATIFDERRHVSFAIEAGPHEPLVDCKEAVQIGAPPQWTSAAADGFGNFPKLIQFQLDKERASQLAWRMPSDTDDYDEWAPREYREAVILEGDTVAVFGMARWVDATDAAPEIDNYREAPKRLVISAPPKGWLMISAET
jgi:hypothetical protein